MADVRRPAIKIRQGKRTLFLTSFTVREFLRDGFYQVDRLDVQSSTGMQRLLNESRANGLGNDLVDADEHDEAFLPTSVFLATGGSISYDERTKELFFDTAEHYQVCPLDVVDGQHRLEGLKVAATKTDRLMDFEISVIIAHEMTNLEKMLQFVTVNTKQQAVDTGVVQHITARFTEMDGIGSLPYLPKWLKREVEKGEDEQALQIARFLNSDETSAWHGKIQFADETRSHRHSITQKSFVSAIKKNILNKFHPYNTLPLNDDKKMAVLRNYWTAVHHTFVQADSLENDGIDWVAYKSNGMQFFLLIFGPILNSLARDRQYTTEAFERCFVDIREHLPPNSIVVMSPDYWKKGGGASGLNLGGIRVLAADFTQAIGEADSEDVRV